MKKVKVSARGELEITDLNRMISKMLLSMSIRSAGATHGLMRGLWIREFVRVIEKAQGLPIAVVEEAAYENGWIARRSCRQRRKNIRSRRMDNILRMSLKIESWCNNTLDFLFILSTFVVLPFALEGRYMTFCSVMLFSPHFRLYE
ncbi:hypothetical protein FHX77_000952 [Bifidobacterium commune]|nr:hypothetical protein [Bifidobacterium commune]